MNALELALYARLTTFSALTTLLAGTASVYNQQAPTGAALPYVVFNLMAGGDDNDNPNRALSLLYNVKAVGTAGFLNSGNIDTQIDAALHAQTLTVSGWANIWTHRITNQRYVETVEGGRRYFHAGGQYRIRIAQ